MTATTHMAAQHTTQHSITVCIHTTSLAPIGCYQTMDSATKTALPNSIMRTLKSLQLGGVRGWHIWRGLNRHIQLRKKYSFTKNENKC